MSNPTIHNAKLKQFKIDVDKKIDSIVKQFVETDDLLLKKQSERRLENYKKYLNNKIFKDDLIPLRLKLRKTYYKKLKEQTKELKQKYKEKVDQLKQELNQEQKNETNYVEWLKNNYNVKLVEYKQHIYSAFIKKVSTRSYSQFLKNVVNRTFYTTLNMTVNTPWRQQFNDRLFESSKTAKTINDIVFFSNNKSDISVDFMVFYSQFIPYDSNNNKYYREVVTKVNTQVGFINYVSTEMSCFKILRDLLLAHNNDAINYDVFLDWYDKYKVYVQEYIRLTINEDESISDEEENDIHDLNRTFRRTHRHIDNLIYKTFPAMNDSHFLARTYFYSENMNDPMTYLALDESNYDLVYNLYLELLLMVLICKISTTNGEPNALHKGSFEEIMQTYVTPNSDPCLYNIAQNAPGFITAILMYHCKNTDRIFEIMHLFLFNTNKIKGREQVRGYIVKVSLLMIKLVIEIINELAQPNNFIKSFWDILKNPSFIKLGILHTN